MTTALFLTGAQCLAGVVAAVICLRAVRGREDVGRRWRLLAGIGLRGWSAVRFWSLIRPADDIRVADLGFLVLPVLLLVALLNAAVRLPRPVPLPG